MPCYALCVCRVASKVEQTLPANEQFVRCNFYEMQNSVTSLVTGAKAAACKFCSSVLEEWTTFRHNTRQKNGAHTEELQT